MDLSGQSPRELLKLYIAVMDRLRALQVVRSANQPVGDVAELLVAKAYGVQLETQATRGYDLVVPDPGFPNGRRIEVKARRVSAGVKASHYSFLRGLRADPPPFDSLVVVHFNDDFDVLGAWEMPVGYVRERVGKLNVRTGGQRLALVKPQDLADKRVRELKLPSLDSVEPSELCDRLSTSSSRRPGSRFSCDPAGVDPRGARTRRAARRRYRGGGAGLPAIAH